MLKKDGCRPGQYRHQQVAGVIVSGEERVEFQAIDRDAEEDISRLLLLQQEPKRLGPELLNRSPAVTPKSDIEHRHPLSMREVVTLKVVE